MGLFDSPKKKVGFAEPGASAEARAQLVALGKESVAFPTREIADLTDMELEVERQAQQLLAAPPSPERDKVLQEFLQTATTDVDVANLPELQAIFKKIEESGQLEAGRLGRSTQIRGAAGQTTFKDKLGRLLTDIQERLVGAATPFLIEARREKAQAGRDVSNIVGQRESEQFGRMGLGSAVGSLRRDITQAKLDAPLEAILRDIEFRFGVQPGILASALVTPQAVVKGGGPSELQKAAGIASQIAPFVMPFMGPTAGAATTGSAATSTTMGGALSDIRAKENIVPIENALEKLLQLEGFTFRMKETGEEKAGIIAQDLEKVLPEGVIEIDGIKHIKLDAVLGLIISAIKEMN